MKIRTAVIAFCLTATLAGFGQKPLQYEIRQKQLDGIRKISDDEGGYLYASLNARIPKVQARDSSDFSFVNKKIWELIKTSTDINYVSGCQRLKDSEIPRDRSTFHSFLFSYSVIRQTNELLWINFDYEHYAGASIGVVSRFTLMFDLKEKRSLQLTDIVEPSSGTQFKSMLTREMKAAKFRYPVVQDQNTFLSPIAISGTSFIVFVKTRSSAYQYLEPLELPLDKVAAYLTSWMKTQL